MKKIKIIANPKKLTQLKLNKLIKKNNSENDDDYDLDKKSFEKTRKLPLTHIILWFSLFFFTIMSIWAYFAIIDEVTHSMGQVIPSQKTQIIQNLEGGILKEILVNEGQVVEKDQTLLRINDTKFSSRFRENKLNILGLKIKIARLKAEIHKKPFNTLDNIKKEAPDLVSYEQSLFKSRKEELSILHDDKKLLLEEIKMTEPLLPEGVVSKVEVLRLKQRLNDVNRSISNVRSRTLHELSDAKVKLSRLQETQQSLKDQLDRTDIKSPVKGIVKQIYVSTIGGVIKPGMPLVEIVPLDDTLLIEARVKPNDIGFIHKGQSATIKITAYDYSIYGGLHGKIEHISADTSVDNRGNSFYELWVRTDQNYLEKNGQKLNIIPGMQASVDILTGKKSILDYLLKPILKTKHNALRER